MIIVETKEELSHEIMKQTENKRSIGFVPTMGALHEGHTALMDRAKAENDVLVVSIFINPIQFGPDEDFERYPRTFEADKKQAKKHGTDILFVPSVKEIYPRPLHNKISVIKGSDVLCGKSRPNHFEGVATVVLKLFQLVRPNRAYFGQKDAQQVAVINNMVTDFHLPVHIVAVPTVREKDGLALSSRNKNLTAAERAEAVTLYHHLQKAADRIISGERRYDKVQEEIKHSLSLSTTGRVDYFEILSFPSLSKDQIEKAERIIVAAALQYSKARLIDNIILDVEPPVR